MEKNIPRASIHVGEDKKSFSAQVSDEAERRGWDEKRYQFKNAEEDKNNHYNFSRKQLNFEIAKGGKIVPLGSNPMPLHKRLQQRYDELGFKPYMDAEHPGQVSKNTPNCVVNILFGGDHEVMKRLAFGDQELDTSDPYADHSNIVLMQAVYDWALDTYRFACRKWGEENVIGFCVHCDETGIHAHVLTVPVEQVKKRGRIGSIYVRNDNPEIRLSAKEWKALPKEERANYTRQEATKEKIECVSYAKVWGETRKEKSEYLTQLHTDYYNEVGYKYGLERGIPYEELSEEEKRERKHKNKVTLEAERLAKASLEQAKQEKEQLESENKVLASENASMRIENKELIDQKEQTTEELAAVNEQLQSANDELASTNAQTEEARKDLHAAQSGFMAKIFAPGKRKKEEEEKHVAAVEEGKRSVLDAIIKAAQLRFSKPPTPEWLGKYLRELYSNNKSLEQQGKEKDATIAEKDKTIKKLNATVTKLTAEVKGLNYNITLIDATAVTSLREELATQTRRANNAEANLENLQTRWNSLWENPEIRDLWEQIQRRKDRYNDILDKLTTEAAVKLRSFGNTQRIHFSDDECESLYYGTVARCMKLGLEPMVDDNRTKAMDEIFSSMSWSGVRPSRSDCCKSWSNLYAYRMDIDKEIVNSVKAVIADMCLSNHYVSLMGSNGAAHTLTNWDGSQVTGLGAVKKKQCGMSM